jgi:hypothetical protein
MSPMPSKSDGNQSKSAGYLDHALKTDAQFRGAVAWLLVSRAVRDRTVRAREVAKYGERAAI